MFAFPLLKNRDLELSLPLDSFNMDAGNLAAENFPVMKCTYYLTNPTTAAILRMNDQFHYLHLS